MYGKRLEGYLSVTEAAEQLGVTRQGILYLINKGQMAPVRYVGEHYLIPEETIARLIQERHGTEDGRVKIK